MTTLLRKLPPPRIVRPVLRDYQRRAISQAVSVIDRRPLIVSPTGSGKTVTAAAMVRDLDVPTLWLAHRQELIEQAASALRRNGLEVGIVKAGVEPTPEAMIQVASIQSLARRDKPDAMLIVIDEAHHATVNGYRNVLECYPESYVIGLTATPFRLDGRGLGDVFGEIVVSAYTDDLVKSGVLHAPKVYAGSPPDLRGVKVTAGDYNLAQLSQRMTSEITADVVKTWQERAVGRRTVVFAVDVEHSRRIIEAFNASGIAAEHLDGTTPKDERRSILGRLRDGVTEVVSNCMVLTEGWDLPALECAIVCRPTASLNLHMQMIGRVMRAADGKTDCIVLDHAGNHHLHGLVTRRLAYSLDGSKKVGEEEKLGLRQCHACFVLYESNLPACPECGHVPTPAERSEPLIHGNGKLTEFTDDFAYRRHAWHQIEAEREAAGYRSGWSLFRFEERFGVKPVIVDGETRELIDPKNATMDEKETVFRQFSDLAEAKGLNPGFASHKYREIFGCWPSGGIVGRVRPKTETERAALKSKWKSMKR